MFMTFLYGNAKTIGMYYGDLGFVLNTDDHTAKLTDIYHPDYHKENVIIDSHLTYDKENYTVIEISEKAFSGCTDIVNLTIPKTIKKIGKDAFARCTIRKLKVEDLSAWCNIDFYNENSNPMRIVNSISIENNTTGNIIFPANISTIKKLSFYGSKLRTVDLSKTSIAELQDSVFYNNYELTNVVLPKAIKRIGKSTFERCFALETIDFPNTLISIGSECFRSCSKLKINGFPESINTIEDYAFSGCI